MRNLKKIGLLLAAVMAMAAVMASAAQANDGIFTAEKEGVGKYPAIITAEQEPEAKNRFTVGPVFVECEVGTFHGTAEKASQTLTITPTYSECETSLGSGATIDVAEGCGYLFHVGTVQDAPADDEYAGTVDIHCESEPNATAIRVTAGLCNIDVRTQTGINGITYTNITPTEHEEETGVKKDVTLDVDSTNVEVKGTNVFLCPSEVVNATTGTYESSVTVKAFEEKEDDSEGDQIDALISTKG